MGDFDLICFEVDMNEKQERVKEKLLLQEQYEGYFIDRNDNSRKQDSLDVQEDSDATTVNNEAKVPVQKKW